MDPAKVVGGGRFDEAARYLDPTLLLSISTRRLLVPTHSSRSSSAPSLDQRALHQAVELAAVARDQVIAATDRHAAASFGKMSDGHLAAALDDGHRFDL